MKKLFFVMLCMIFAVCSANAQLGLGGGLYGSVMKQDISKTKIPDSVVISNFKVNNDPTYVPLLGKHKFTRTHYIYQTLGISFIFGKDSGIDRRFDKQSRTIEEVENSSSQHSSTSPDTNEGLNVGYSVSFVPGTVVGDKLKLNRFGFAYSVGFIAAFDKQQEYGVTCDFMGKIGVEVGCTKKIGVGLDLLFGGGKGSGCYANVTDDDSADGETLSTNNIIQIDESDINYYSDWCLKYGAQFSLKLNVLKQSAKNNDLLLFSRFVYSINPYDDTKVLEHRIFNMWLDESWQFGIAYRYHF